MNPKNSVKREEKNKFWEVFKYITFGLLGIGWIYAVISNMYKGFTFFVACVFLLVLLFKTLDKMFE